MPGCRFTRRSARAASRCPPRVRWAAELRPDLRELSGDAADGQPGLRVRVHAHIGERSPTTAAMPAQAPLTVRVLRRRRTPDARVCESTWTCSSARVQACYKWQTVRPAHELPKLGRSDGLGWPVGAREHVWPCVSYQVMRAGVLSRGPWTVERVCMARARCHRAHVYSLFTIHLSCLE